MSHRLRCGFSVVFIFFLSFYSYAQRNHKFILAIGDSHGAWETGWVNQLRKLRPNDSIMNVTISGNTIGFDNLGRTSLNELKNIQQHLTDADSVEKDIDYIIVLLGTNDCKAVFDSLQRQVSENLDRLLQTISSFHYHQSSLPKILLATPPPMAQDEKLEPKYYGGKKRLEKLLPIYKSLSEKYQCKFINTYDSLLADFESLNQDGIHLKEEGYRRIAVMINENL